MRSSTSNVSVWLYYDILFFIKHLQYPTGSSNISQSAMHWNLKLDN